jgi:hypothetical protein
MARNRHIGNINRKPWLRLVDNCREKDDEEAEEEEEEEEEED